MKERKPDLRNIGFIVLVVAAVVAAIMLIVNFVNKRNNAIQTESGIAIIESRESIEPDTVKADIQAQIHERLMAQLEQKLKQVENDEINVWTLFDGVMVMGDSRASGFSIYGFLTDNQVIAHNGDSLSSILPELDRIRVFNPTILILSYGINDIWNGTYAEPEDFTTKYRDVISSLEEALPDTSIYISSIMKCTEAGIARNQNAARVPEFNEALKAMCEENGFVYIDNDKIADEYEHLYYADGVHQSKDFYEVWAKNIISTIYRHQASEQEAKKYEEISGNEQQ